MNNVIVSVIVPCYNQGQYIDECLQSVVNQTFKMWECIIVNDGSTDDSEERIANWVKNDTRFICINQSNKGLCKSRNEAIRIAKGSYILPLDADDYISTNDIEECYNEFVNNDAVVVVYGNAVKFGEVNETWRL